MAEVSKPLTPLKPELANELKEACGPDAPYTAQMACVQHDAKISIYDNVRKLPHPHKVMAAESKPQRLYTQEEVNALLLKSAEDRIAHDKLIGCISVGFTGGVGGLVLGGPFGGLGGAAAGCWLGNKIAGDTSDAINILPSASEMEKIIKKSKEEAARWGRAIGKTAEQLSGEQNYEKEIPSYPAPSEPTHGLPEQPQQPALKQQRR